jgi:GxxExxY protein
LESVYQATLAYELEKRGLRVTRQQAIPVVYEAIRIDTGFHADLVVEDKVIVEIKSVETVAPVHNKQLLSYLKLADKRLGLLINFNVVTDQEWHHTYCEPPPGVTSRKDAKAAKTTSLE